MEIQIILFHYGVFQPQWQQSSLIQAGPQIDGRSDCLFVPDHNIHSLIEGLRKRNLPSSGVLIHYTDPFLLRVQPLRYLAYWSGPRLLVCGDLHHGERPLDILSAYQQVEPHDAVLLAFNPVMLFTVQERLSVPVRSLPPTFFRYPQASQVARPRLELLHVGSLGPHHFRRLELLMALKARGRLPFRHVTTTCPQEAAQLYAQYALVLNVPLNQDLNHRFFEVMAAGVPQVVFGDPSLVGEHRYLAERPDIFWASTLDDLENLVLRLFAEPACLRNVTVAPPPYRDLKDLLKAAFSP